MEDWQVRVLEERDDLEEKLSKLAQHLNNNRSLNSYNECSPVARYHCDFDMLLSRQYEIMLQYHQILTQRICLFRKK